MNTPEVVILVNPDGSYELEVNGVKGASCVELTRKLEALLGESGQHQHKTEFYEKEQKTNITHKTGGG